jgi:AraC-like DNA-binding protein
MNPNLPYVKSWSDNAEQLQLKIPVSVLRRYLECHDSFSEFSNVDFANVVLSIWDDCRQLLSLIEFVCRDYLDENGLWRSPHVLEQMEKSLLAALLHTFPHRETRGRSGVRSAAAPYYVHRAEAYIRANLQGTIRLPAICAAAGVSARTLHDGFRGFRDSTPAQYVRDLRLDLARERILSSTSPQETVTQIALSCGFNHLGRFSSLYKNRFGEMPLQALRRTRAAPG